LISHTLFTRLNNKVVDRLVVIMQRLHEDDMIGRLTRNSRFEKLSFSAIARSDETIVIRAPFGTIEHQQKEDEALHEAREPLWMLYKLRDEMGSSDFAAQYLGEPSPPGGGLIKSSWFMRYDPADPRPHFIKIFQSWDCAFKVREANDHSVCTTWGLTSERQLYLLHVFRGKLEFPALKRKVRELAHQHRAGFVIIEDAASGTPLIQELMSEGFARIVPFKVRGDKIMCMKTVTPKMENGQVWIPPAGALAFRLPPRTRDVLNGRFDDQVDSTSQALAYVAAPVPGESYVAWLASEMVGDERMDLDKQTVTFDLNRADETFTTNEERLVRRGKDGFYHVSPEEWNGCFSEMYGVTLIHVEERDRHRVYRC
jgi:predicted phage terminase large subunit-like protein